MPSKPDSDPCPPLPPTPPEGDMRLTSSAAVAAVKVAYANHDKAADGSLTAEDIRREHEIAFASLSAEQARALARMNRAFRESHLGNCSAKEALERVYEEEARERNTGQQSERPEDGSAE